MKSSNQAALALVIFLPVFANCRSSDDNNEVVGRTLVVEVGDGVPGLYLGSTAPETDGDVKQQEIQQCRELFGEDIEGWKIAGSENELSIEATQAFAVKITGSQNILNLAINAKEGETALVNFPGVCLVLGGNQPTVNASLNGVSLEQFKIVAEGNSANININLKGGASLPEGVTEDVGKHATVTVTEAAE